MRSEQLARFAVNINIIIVPILIGGCLGPRNDTVFFGESDGLPENATVMKAVEQTQVLTDEYDMRLVIKRFERRGEYDAYVCWFCKDFGTSVDADSVNIRLLGKSPSGVSRRFGVRILRRGTKLSEGPSDRWGQYVNVDFEPVPPKGQSIDPSEVIVRFRLKTRDKQVVQRELKLLLYAEKVPAFSPITVSYR